MLARRRGRLGSFFKGKEGGGEALEFRAEDIGGEGEEPGGEAGFATPLREATPGAEESLLRHFFGTAAVAAVAPSHVNERPLPATDDAGEGLDVAGEDAVDVGEVLIRAGG